VTQFGTFGIDLLACAHCGGRLRLVANLRDPPVIRTILTHAIVLIGQSLGPARPSPARGLGHGLIRPDPPED